MPARGGRVGRIITFCSYKGGTGRSMAVANVAWILASNGNRVLVIDWDLEAPGLHRYLHPFIRDKKLSATRGVVDFIVEFASAALATSDSAKAEASQWFLPYTNILRNAVSLEGEHFLGPGTVDIVVAGKQDPQYATRVNSFDWRGFYDRLGGGVFLEAVKQKVKEEYDYILTDSRTGVSDTSGICTVQMPDDLVVCFTYNNQSIEGAIAVAASVYAQRRRPDGRSSIQIWPVPMRVELAEKDKLEAARDLARTQFASFVGHLSAHDQEQYWKRIEVLYQPYYAYEEILAVFGDTQGQTNSMLSSMEILTAYLTDDRVRQVMPSAHREEIVLRYSRVPVAGLSPKPEVELPLVAPREAELEEGPEAPLPKSDREKLVLQRLEDQISWYDSKSIFYQKTYKRIKVIEIMAATAIPFLSALNISAGSNFGHAVSWLIGGLGFLIAILEGMLMLNQYQQNWISYRSTCEALKHERYLYLLHSGAYSGVGNAVALLAERVEGLISQEQVTRHLA